MILCAEGGFFLSQYKTLDFIKVNNNYSIVFGDFFLNYLSQPVYYLKLG